MRRGLGWVLVGVGALLLLVLSGEPRPGDRGGLSVQDAHAQALLKYTGGASCGGSKCHGNPTPRADFPKMNENTIWQQKDKHAKAYETLTNERLKSGVSPSAMAKKLGIAKAETSDRCLVCHAVNAKPAQRGSKFDISDGVHCEGCHGPAEKWLESHAEKGWTHEQSVKLGMYDTRDLLLRAENCVSCHLAIDADMVAAGHPDLLAFELDTFSRNMSQPPHYRSEPPLSGARAWALGQIVALREAAKQLGDRAKGNAPARLLEDGNQKVVGHAAVVGPLLGVVAPAAQRSLDQDVAALSEQVKKGDRAAMGATAAKIGQTMTQQAGAVAKREFTQAETQKLVDSLGGAADPISGRGIRSAEQTAMALDRLSLAFYRSKGQRLPKAASDALDKVFEALPEQPAKYDAKSFAAAIKGFQAQFGK
jgi:Cytochrome c554 and c-prime